MKFRTSPASEPNAACQVNTTFFLDSIIGFDFDIVT